jgi:hypothetical protein
MLGLIGLLCVIYSGFSTLSLGDATVQGTAGARRTGWTSIPSRAARDSGMCIFGGKGNAETKDVSAKADVAAGGSAHQQLAFSQSVDQKCVSKYQMSASSSSDDEISISTSVDRGPLGCRNSLEKEGHLGLQEAAKTAKKKKRNIDKSENLSESMPIASVQAGLSSTDVADGQMGAAGSASPQERPTEMAQRASGSNSNVLSIDK